MRLARKVAPGVQIRRGRHVDLQLSNPCARGPPALHPGTMLANIARGLISPAGAAPAATALPSALSIVRRFAAEPAAAVEAADGTITQARGCPGGREGAQGPRPMWVPLQGA